MGFVLKPLVYKNIIVEPILREKMVLIRRAISGVSKNRIVHPRDLNPQNEFFIDWGPSFRIWHDHWWVESIRPHLHVDTAGLILQLMDNPSYWAVVPLSMAQSFQQSKHVEIYDISEPPPERIVYQLTHQYPKPSSLQALDIVRAMIGSFAEQYKSGEEWVR